MEIDIILRTNPKRGMFKIDLIVWKLTPALNITETIESLK